MDMDPCILDARDPSIRLVQRTSRWSSDLCNWNKLFPFISEQPIPKTKWVKHKIFSTLSYKWNIVNNLIIKKYELRKGRETMEETTHFLTHITYEETIFFFHFWSWFIIFTQFSLNFHMFQLVAHFLNMMYHPLLQWCVWWILDWV